MSDYTKTTNFTAKDNLASGNPSKLILGADHDTEYDNIATAVATKANKVSSAVLNDMLKMDANGDLVGAGFNMSNVTNDITSSHTELNYLDGSIPGTATAGNAVVVDGSKDIAGINSLTVTNLTIGATALTATAAELNTLDGITSTVAELNILDGVTSTASEINLLDGSSSSNNTASVAAILDSDKGLYIPTASPTPPSINTLYSNNIIKAWGHCDGIPATSLISSFNASFSRPATGVYNITFDTALTNTNYAVTVTGASLTTVFFVSSLSTTGFTITSRNTSGTATDNVFMFMVVGE